MSYLVDTDWIINALGEKRQASSTLNRAAPAGLSISQITVGEIYEVAFRSVNPEAHLATLRQFLMPFRKLGIDDSIVERFAEIRSFLRRRGELIPDFDILISATALHYDLTVLTFNVRHFSRIPDLRLYQHHRESP